MRLRTTTFLLIGLLPSMVIGCARARQTPHLRVDSSIIYSNSAAPHLHLIVSNGLPDSLKMMRWAAWDNEPVLSLQCYPIGVFPSGNLWPVGLTEPGLNRWPLPEPPRMPDETEAQFMRREGREIGRLMGTHRQYAKELPQGAHYSFSVNLTNYFVLRSNQQYVVGGMLQIHRTNDEPKWIGLTPQVFRFPAR